MSDENLEEIENEDDAIQNDNSTSGNEHERVNPLQSIIDQQTSQIDALMAQNQKLTAQITNMINNGMQINDGTQQQQQQQQYEPTGNGFGKGNVSLSDDDDYSVASLGKLIGKRDV